MAESTPPLLLKTLDRAHDVVKSLGREWDVTYGSDFEHTVPCPAHDDRKPSLSIGWSAKRHKVLLDCKAGCDASTVLEALGFTWGDLREKHVKRKFVCAYDYDDAAGNLIFQVVRWDPKDFTQRRRNPAYHPGRGDGKKPWINSVKDEPRAVGLPYRLPELLKALSDGDDIVITEGEKDADAIMLAVGPDAGVAATCNAGGADNWRPEHGEWFRGPSLSTITVVADHDESGKGYRHAVAVADDLERVRGQRPAIVGAAVGKDAADHVENHALSEFEPIPLEDLAEAMSASGTATTGADPEAARSRHVLTAASAYSSRRQRFLWDGRVPLGTLSLFAGVGGVGKSTFALWLAAQAQAGNLAGDLLGEPIRVLYVSVEDDWSTQVKPRLQAVGANLDTLYNLQIASTADETGERHPNLPQDVPAIAQAVEDSGARLVILDPITSTMSGDDHKRSDVRAVLDPIAQMAAELDCVVLGIMHFNKGGGHASDKLSGSHAWRDTARSVLHFARDDDRNVVVLSQDKGNYAEAAAHSLEYRLVDTIVELDDGEVGHHPQVEMLGESATSVQDLINRDPAPTDASLWLAEFMHDYPEGVPSKLGLQAARENGHNADKIQRARSRLGIEARKGAMDDGWYWVPKKAASREGPHPSPSSSNTGDSAAFFGEGDAESVARSSGAKNASSSPKNAREIPEKREESEEGVPSRARAREHVIKRRLRPNNGSGEMT